MEEVPSKLKVSGGLILAAGAINLMAGWGISSLILTFVGGFCTSIVTLGMCPLGVFCGFLPMLMIPLALVEIIIGIIALAAPENTKGFISFVPFAMIPAILIGDIMSPVLGAVVFVMLRDAEVQDWLSAP